ncbi:MAG: ROK family protein [Actinomycetaceae bacterium]|nr:ROK family protein [Actinomycetaceae bacterium]MDY5272611.1 ROK family protein [Arcanobacterium sp.]
MAPSRGGRPARYIGLVSSAGHAVGVKIAQDHVTFVEVGIDGAVLRNASEPFDPQSRQVLSVLGKLVKTFISNGGDRTVLGVGIGVPGVIDEEEIGTVGSTLLGWNNVTLGRHLQRELDLPVLVDNNVNALSIAELLYGRAQGHEEVLVITIGTGVGAGIISGGKVLRGYRGGAGEIGHVPYVEDGPLCQCGARGCVEALIGQSALMAEAERIGIPNAAGYDSLVAAARHENGAAQQIFADAGHILGRTLAGAVNILCPELVILSGEGVVAWEYWELGFEPAFRRALVPHNVNVPVLVEAWQDERWAQGAASLVLATPFDNGRNTGRQGRLVRERLQSLAEV